MALTQGRWVKPRAAAEPATAVAKPRRSFGHFLSLIPEAKSLNGSVAYNARVQLDKLYGSSYAEVKDDQVTKAALAEEIGQRGGYLVPVDYTLAIMNTFAEHSFIYPRATVVPMNSAQTLCPKFDVETAPSAAGVAPWFGGMLFKWGSSQAPAETEPAFKQMTLKAWDLLGYSVLSNQFLMDSGDKAQEYLIRMFGRACAWYAEYAFLQGTGTSTQMPTGILNAPCLKTTTRAGAGHLAAADVANLAGALMPYSWDNAVWACSPTALVDVVKITQFYLNVPSAAGQGSAGCLLGKPLFVTEKLPPLGTKGDLVLMDPTLYVIGERQQVVVDVSDQALFQNYQSVYRIWYRCDGKPALFNTVTLQDTSTTVSAFCTVAT